MAGGQVPRYGVAAMSGSVWGSCCAATSSACPGRDDVMRDSFLYLGLQYRGYSLSRWRGEVWLKLDFTVGIASEWPRAGDRR